MERLRNFAGAAEVLAELSQTLDEKDPRFFDVLLQAGRCFEEAGSRDKAAEFYKRVCRGCHRHPQRPGIHRAVSSGIEARIRLCHARHKERR